MLFISSSVLNESKKQFLPEVEKKDIKKKKIRHQVSTHNTHPKYQVLPPSLGLMQKSLEG